MHAPQAHPLICLPQYQLKRLHVPAAIYRHPRLWDPVPTTSRHDFPLAQSHEVAIKHVLSGGQLVKIGAAAIKLHEQKPPVAVKHHVNIARCYSSWKHPCSAHFIILEPPLENSILVLKTIIILESPDEDLILIIETLVLLNC
jgi:hypothetical protein